MQAVAIDSFFYMQKDIILFFQKVGTPFWDAVFTGFTMLGEQFVIILVISWIYWNSSKKFGIMITFTYLTSMLINDIFKIMFQTPRPFEVLDIEGKRNSTATGYSFPSGHTQGATTLFLSIALAYKKRYLFLTAVFIALAVAVSRMYLGAHWLEDVLGALIFGVIISIIMFSLQNSIFDNNSNYRNFVWFMMIIAIFAGAIIIGVKFFNYYGNLYTDNYFRILGVLLGAGTGFLIEDKFVDFENSGKVSKKIIRFLLGVVTAIAFMALIKILPEGIISQFFVFALLGFWISCGFPFVGKKISLF